MTDEEKIGKQTVIAVQFILELASIDYRNSGLTVAQVERDLRDRARLVLRILDAVGDPQKAMKLVRSVPIEKLKRYAEPRQVVA